MSFYIRHLTLCYKLFSLQEDGTLRDRVRTWNVTHVANSNRQAGSSMLMHLSDIIFTTKIFLF